MKLRFIKYTNITSLLAHNARNQAMIAIILVAIIPSLSLFYIGRMAANSHFTFSAISIILLLTILIGFLGFVVLRKYPDNIMKLRQYITEIARGTLPDKIVLADTQSSDDIKYIEDSFNYILAEMRHRIEVAEEQLRVEHVLKETIEQQQQTLLEAERHRVMIQTLGATCHHIGQPATVLQIRLDFLQKLATNEDEIKEITGCINAVQTISNILHQLQQVSEFRTVPYVSDGSCGNDAILAIDQRS